jgi:hypothetical protein
MPQARRSQVQFLMKFLDFSTNVIFTAPEMSTGNLAEVKGQPAHEADNLTAICNTVIYKMWAPGHLNPMVPQGLLQGYRFLLFLIICATSLLHYRR